MGGACSGCKRGGNSLWLISQITTVRIAKISCRDLPPRIPGGPTELRDCSKENVKL